MKKFISKLSQNLTIYGLPAIALLGIVIALRVVSLGNRAQPLAEPLVEPAKNSYESSVAGAGIVEAFRENIAIASNVAGVVSKIQVQVGARVNPGDSLFSIDDKQLKAERLVKEGALSVAQALRVDAASQLAFAEKVGDKRAISADELTKRKNALAVADARVTEAKAALFKVDTELERLTVASPISGEVLRINIRVGEFAPAQQVSTPLMIVGDTSKLWVRVDIDENNAWRVESGAKAKAYLRGNPEISVPLNFVRFERYVAPKRSLTGDNNERVDTRVLQIIYDFDPSKIPVYVGQLMDVYIEAKSHG